MHTDKEALRDNYEERAAILEYDAGYKRPEAERLARLLVYGKDTNNNETKTPPPPSGYIRPVQPPSECG